MSDVAVALQAGGGAVELLQKECAGNATPMKIALMYWAKVAESSRVIVVGA